MSQLEISTGPAPTSEQLDQIALLFKVLGEPMRLRILQTVCHAPRYVGEIVELTGATQPNVSKHLALLVASGVLKRERDGQRVRYWLKNQLITRLCEAVCASLQPHETAGNLGESLA
jgi:DNA-binding transcriptional ArsR family regulator